MALDITAKINWILDSLITTDLLHLIIRDGKLVAQSHLLDDKLVRA